MSDRPNDLELRALYQRLVEMRSDRARPHCPAPEQIVALADRTLTENERLDLLSHVSACSFCQQDLTIVRAVALPAARQSPGGVMRWTGALAAAALVLFAVLMVRDRRSNEPDVMRGTPAVIVIRPSPSVPATDSVFVWRTVDRARGYQIEVMTAGGSVVQSGQTADTTWALPRRLAPGEYLWRVTASITDGSTRSSPAIRFEAR